MKRNLADWLAHAERVHPVGIDMGLVRVREVAQRLGVLPPAARNVVIAGTNGKGSTSVYLEALLRAAGYTVGTTVSPHLNRFNERVRLNGCAVGDANLCDAFEAIEAARDDITLTYFEFGVLVALLVFRRANVDVTVLEVGLGGRLDAVNIVDATVSVITSIGIDHVGYLGPDRDSIGSEKAGILRPAVPCVYGESSIPDSIVAAARAQQSPLLRRDIDFHAEATSIGWNFVGPRGSGQVTLEGLGSPSVALSNAATALQALLLLEPRDDVSIREWVAAAAQARLPARFERFECGGVAVIVDVAHNPHGAAFLCEQLVADGHSGRTVGIAGFLQDKDAAGIVAALEGCVNEWIFVSTDGPRGQTASQSLSKAGLPVRATALEGDLVGVFDEVLWRLTSKDRLVVFGCFNVAQRARELLHGEVVARG